VLEYTIVANTGVAGWLLRIAAVAFGVACLLVLTAGTLGGALIVLLVVGALHAYRRRAGRSLTLLQSWMTTVVATAMVATASFAWAMSLHDKTGGTVWHALLAAADSASRHPSPPPGFLRSLPGAYVQPTPMPAGAAKPLLGVGLLLGAETMGVIIGSLVWGAAWLTASGWIGRLAGVKPATYPAP
jgi:hypothetical protein